MSELFLYWDWNGTVENLQNFRILVDFAGLSRDEPAIPEPIVKPASARAATISGLEKDTEYVINLSALGRNGKRFDSGPRTAETLDILNVTVTAVELLPGPGRV